MVPDPVIEELTSGFPLYRTFPEPEMVTSSRSSTDTSQFPDPGMVTSQVEDVSSNAVTLPEPEIFIF